MQHSLTDDTTFPVNVADVSNNLLNSDALFTNPTANDYSIQTNSPAIDAGNPSILGVNLPTTDILGNPRINNTIIDLGAIESQQPTASFTISTSSNPTAGGNTSGGGTFTSGSSITVSATPNQNYNFINWMVPHWILNPGIAINELILGQRVPKTSLVDKTSTKPLFERTFVPCPHCQTLHEVRNWSTENGTAFKNWFGLYCKNCGNIIPCLMNVLSFLILAFTFPIWGWFRTDLKEIWLKKQPKRFKHIDVNKIPNRYSRKNWIKTGLTWGPIMFFITLIGSVFFDEQEITMKTLLLKLVIWVFGGLVFSYFMKVYTRSRNKIET